MTDMEKLKALLDQWGVPYTEEEKSVTVQRTAEDHPKISGYRWFLTRFEFTRHGDFSAIGAWE
jgi:hypothetical protein